MRGWVTESEEKALRIDQQPKTGIESKAALKTPNRTFFPVKTVVAGAAEETFEVDRTSKNLR
jgi:hypothetical protein